MQFVEVTDQNIADAGRIHSESWKASHQSVCSAAFVETHTPSAQEHYLRREIAMGKRLYMLIDESPVGIVSVHGDLIENLYVLPSQQRKGYGTQLLEYAIQQCSGDPRLWILSTNENARCFYSRNSFKGTGNKRQLKDKLYEIELSQVHT